MFTQYTAEYLGTSGGGGGGVTGDQFFNSAIIDLILFMSVLLETYRMFST